MKRSFEFGHKLMLLTVALTSATVAQCQEVAPQATTPGAQFQAAAITGSGNTINVSRVPVTANGTTTYYDVTLTFEVSAGGVLSLNGSPAIAKSPNLITAGFKAGNYAGPSNVLSGDALITVNGPGVAPGGATEWSLSSSPGASGCTYPGTATWYVGPINTNPLAARLKAAGITSTSMSYGVGGTGCYGDWEPNSLLGFIQTANALTIVSFTFNGTDHNVPQDQITYTHK